MEEGDGGEQFHRNEAISAVADDGGFVMVDEEEEDYEDLYNDVNIGETFHNHNTNNQTMTRNEDADEEEEEKKVETDHPTVSMNVDVVGEQEIQEKGGVGVGFSGNESVSKGAAGGGDLRIELGHSSGRLVEKEAEMVDNRSQGVMRQQMNGGAVGNNEGFARQGGGYGPGNGGVGVGVGVGGAGGGYGAGNNGGGGGNNGGVGGGGGSTMLFVGDLLWWTTDADIEGEVCRYGNVREVKFFEEKASGKSKGYCQVEFYDPAAATACKDGMNGHLFNGKPCVVAYASSPYSIRRMGEAQVNKNQAMAQSNLPPGRMGGNDGGGRGGGNNMQTGGGFRGGDAGGRGYGRGNWGRGRGQVGPMRNRMGGNGFGQGGRGIMGNGGGNGFGQGMQPNPQMMHPQSMMGQGFDPAYGSQMGQMGGYGGFPTGPTPYPGMMQSFPPVGGVGLSGVAPHVNPSFFGRGMPANGMGMMPATGMDRQGMNMWSDPSTAGWAGEDPAGRAAESSYEDAASDHQYGDGGPDRGGRRNALKDKDRVSERDWSGSSDRKYRDERDPEADRDIPRDEDGYNNEYVERRPRDDRELSRDRERTREKDSHRERERDRDRDRERYREDRDRHVDHRYKDRGPEYDDMGHNKYKDREPEYDEDWDRGRSSRAYSKSRVSYEEDYHARGRDVSKRRRLPSE